MNETIEGLNFALSGEYRTNCRCQHCKDMPITISTAIQALKALDQAEKVLPEKTTGHRYDNGSNSAGYCNGRNQTIEDFKPIIAHKDLRIEELNTKILEMGYEAIADGKRIAELEKSTGEIIQDILIQSRDIEKVCSSCLGWGIKAYGDTSTWGKGIGGQMMTSDVCDKCWGSGDESKPWKSWKELQSLTKENEVLREQNLDAVKDYKELQFTKARIKLLEQKLIDNNIKRGVIKNKVYTKSHYNSAKDLYSDLEWLVGRNKVLNIVDNLGSGVVVVTYEI